MSNFAFSNSTTPAGTAQANTGSSYQALVAVIASSGNLQQANPYASALRRGKLYDILVGTNGTPADNYMEWEVARLLAGSTVVYLGSVSSVSSAYVLDTADAGVAALLVNNASAGSSAVLTRVSQPWYVGVNQRASYRWVAAPGSEIVYPAGTSAAGQVNGLAVQCRSGGYTGTATATIMVSEQ